MIRLMFVLAMITAVPAEAGELVGPVTVIDGDTITMRGTRIRLFGIDAPESDQTCRDTAGAAYRCGQVAANALADYLGRQTLRCEERDTDPYGRVVATCRLGATDIGDWLVRQGLAVDYDHFSRGAYAPAQAAAKAGRLGIWRGTFSEPYAYRTCVRRGGRPSECSVN